MSNVINRNKMNQKKHRKNNEYCSLWPGQLLPSSFLLVAWHLGSSLHLFFTFQKELKKLLTSLPPTSESGSEGIK